MRLCLTRAQWQEHDAPGVQKMYECLPTILAFSDSCVTRRKPALTFLQRLVEQRQHSSGGLLHDLPHLRPSKNSLKHCPEPQMLTARYWFCKKQGRLHPRYHYRHHSRASSTWSEYSLHSYSGPEVYLGKKYLKDCVENTHCSRCLTLKYR